LLFEVWLGWFLVAANACPAVAREKASAPPIQFIGNCAVTDEIYLDALNLPSGFKADRKGARKVRRELTAFLHRMGYDLASVSVRRKDGSLQVTINEGRLEKITFLGRGTLRTLQFRFSLQLPCRVFNRPHLERQLKTLSRRHGISSAEYELIRVDKPQETTSRTLPGLKDLKETVPVIHPQGRYDLYIHLGGAEWGEGFDFGAGYRRADGGFVTAAFSSSGLVLPDDRWRVKGMTAAKVRDRLDSGGPYLALSRLQLDGTWYTPDFTGTGFRPYLWLVGDLSSWQRADLDIETYYSGVFDASLNAGFELWRGVMVSLGGGMQGRKVDGIEHLDGAAWPQSPYELWRPFALARAELNFRSVGYRKDRRHAMDLQVRRSFEDRGKTSDRFYATYDWTRPFGWHDLIVRVQGIWLSGTVRFDEDEPIGGRYVRGVFANQHSVLRAASLQVEYRFPLARDVVKLGVFNDLAVFGAQARGDPTDDVRFADSFGLGLHILFLDSFQLDTWYAVGFASDGLFDHGLLAAMKKVF